MAATEISHLLLQFDIAENINISAGVNDKKELILTIKQDKEIQCGPKKVLVNSKVSLGEKEIYSLRNSFAVIQAVQESSSKYWYHGNINDNNKVQEKATRAQHEA